MENKGPFSFEETIDEFANTVLELEKLEYHSSLEPYALHAKKRRQQLIDYFINFKKRFTHGYDALFDEIEKEKQALSDPNRERALEKYRIKESNLEKLEDPEGLYTNIANGKMLYELYDFSNEVVLDFYKAATHLLNAGNFEDAHDGFFFLTIIAPKVSEFWRGLAFSCMELNRFDEAIDSCENAVKIDPESIAAYLTCIRIYCTMKDLERANSFIDKTLDFAKTYQGTPWSKKLVIAMDEARKFVRKNYHNVHNTNHSS